MKKYTVEKPEYKDDETNEALFDAIFGNANFDDNDNEDYLDNDIPQPDDEGVISDG